MFDPNCGPQRGKRSEWDAFGDFFWGGPKRRRPFWTSGRVFEQGDLKYVILQLLAEKPRHGYEIIKALEEKFGGAYAPSPGAVYPTLQLLEDLGYARMASDQEGKKVYEITDAGRAHLAENQATVDSIFDRIGKLVGHFLDEPMTEVHAAFRIVGRATYSRASGAVHDPELLKKVSEILERAAREIDGLPRGPAAGR